MCTYVRMCVCVCECGCVYMCVYVCLCLCEVITLWMRTRVIEVLV